MRGPIFICLMLVLVVSKSYAGMGNGLLIKAEAPIQLNQCPAYNDPNQIALLPYPNDCSKYYACINGFAYAYQCPDNYYWSQLTHRCDFKQYSSCESDESPAPDQFNIQYSAYPGDCELYYETRILRCPFNYQWNVHKQRCDLPEIAGCTAIPTVLPPHSTVTTTVSTNTTPKPGIISPIDPEYMCKSARGKKYLPYTGDCQKFVYCGPMTAVLYCPPGLSWDAKTQACVPGHAGCSDKHKIY